jgi:hypothetical protein
VGLEEGDTRQGNGTTTGFALGGEKRESHVVVGARGIDVAQAEFEVAQIASKKSAAAGAERRIARGGPCTWRSWRNRTS